MNDHLNSRLSLTEAVRAVNHFILTREEAAGRVFPEFQAALLILTDDEALDLLAVAMRDRGL